MTLRERLEAVFAELAERFGVSDARGILITPELDQEGLAEMIGGSRPMVSKLLMEMKQEGVIAREGKHYILTSQNFAGSSRLSAKSPAKLRGEPRRILEAARHDLQTATASSKPI
jgi:DNA-binding IclR family transcriptional regulator